MSKHTPEDFAKARFATHHESGALAMRPAGQGDEPWAAQRITNPLFIKDRSDDHMARNGWTPVVEADPGKLTRLHQEIARLATELDELRSAPLTLDALEAAWEAAEVPTSETPIRKGDVLIRLDDDAAFDVFETKTGHLPVVGYTRVLSRARQPWQDLADVLGRYDLDAVSDQGAEEFARFLHSDGVSVTGGDDQ